MPTDAIASELNSVRTRFDAAGRARRRELIQHAAGVKSADPQALAAYHDVLLFMAAHPDDRAMLNHIEAELARIGAQIDDLSPTARRKLNDTGMVGTLTTHAFSMDLARWLCDRCGNDVDIDMKNAEAMERLEAFLQLLAAPAEADGILCKRLDTRGWLDAARGGTDSDCSSLRWLLGRFDALRAPPALVDREFESLDLELTWRHASLPMSRTGARFPSRPIHFQKRAPVRSVNAREIILCPLSPARPLPVGEATPLLDACRAALSSRRRETDPLTYADPHDVTLHRLENGIDVAVFGMTPQRRLPVESYFGYVAARNRVPCAYGGGWVLGHRCEIGVNIFDEFRGGESALLFAQIMRVYRTMFRIRRFLVDPYQFGAGNEEAIRSGAFWFYYRLGFRPVSARVRQLADDEARRVREQTGYRSPPATLRRLARDRVRLDLAEQSAPAASGLLNTDEVPAPLGDFDLAELGIAVTTRIGRRFSGDTTVATDWSLSHLRRVLGVKPSKSWSANETFAFSNWSPLVAMIGDLDRWTASEKRSLIDVMRAKGGRRESRFARLLRQHPRLIEAFSAISRRQE
ncbi:MAG: hypothetical protein KF841_03445 [Phycisphaerae bacterium]|nr:hypothetical protein [Phycisphaerae bacterium]